ncbi:hypothetical protein Trydic_g17002 [Trypoxylus dichotomus]
MTVYRSELVSTLALKSKTTLFANRIAKEAGSNEYALWQRRSSVTGRVTETACKNVIYYAKQGLPKINSVVCDNES